MANELMTFVDQKCPRWMRRQQFDMIVRSSAWSELLPLGNKKNQTWYTHTHNMTNDKHVSKQVGLISLAMWKLVKAIRSIEHRTVTYILFFIKFNANNDDKEQYFLSLAHSPGLSISPSMPLCIGIVALCHRPATTNAKSAHVEWLKQNYEIPCIPGTTSGQNAIQIEMFPIRIWLLINIELLLPFASPPVRSSPRFYLSYAREIIVWSENR